MHFPLGWLRLLGVPIARDPPDLGHGGIVGSLRKLKTCKIAIFPFFPIFSIILIYKIQFRINVQIFT
jgi:hypothetical protein